ncbi:hypothetical protein Sango_3082800 [Sesamum angolense]|uniref:Aminotransferase-like plant mobile domain-containing protein n=1 Tax=Sesamum angolense TaxID=2727404 RepID=A0AAE1T965_9LAMI|nr:hypothetical protein Sango_3082800 [Sesamum angolense]
MCHDSSGNLVSLLYLAKLEDIVEVRYYSWGSVVLTFLYRELCNASIKGKVAIGGALQLLQVIRDTLDEMPTDQTCGKRYESGDSPILQIVTEQVNTLEALCQSTPIDIEGYRQLGAQLADEVQIIKKAITHQPQQIATSSDTTPTTSQRQRRSYSRMSIDSIERGDVGMNIAGPSIAYTSQNYYVPQPPQDYYVPQPSQDDWFQSTSYMPSHVKAYSSHVDFDLGLVINQPYAPGYNILPVPFPSFSAYRNNIESSSAASSSRLHINSGGDDNNEQNEPIQNMGEEIRRSRCGASKEVADSRVADNLMQFLMGLNDSFDHVRNQILMMEPLPNVTKAYSVVLRVEKQREMVGLHHICAMWAYIAVVSIEGVKLELSSHPDSENLWFEVNFHDSQLRYKRGSHELLASYSTWYNGVQTVVALVVMVVYPTVWERPMNFSASCADNPAIAGSTCVVSVEGVVGVICINGGEEDWDGHDHVSKGAVHQ